MIAALKAHFLHSRTILIARVYSYAGVAVTAYDGVNTYVQGTDFTPLSTRALDYLAVPPDLRALCVTGFIAVTGLVFEKMRRISKTALQTVEPPSV